MGSSFAILWDKFYRNLALSMRSLWLHKLRTFLSVLGIIIGVAAVISLMSFGEGSMRDALDDIERQGAKNIIVRSVKPLDDASSQRRSFILKYGLTYEGDFKRFQMLPSVIESVPMRIFPQEVRRLHRMQNGRVVATTHDYSKITKVAPALGRFLIDSDDFDDEGDDNRMRNVCVLGSDLADVLFPFENPLDKTVVLNKQDFIVVGVLAERMPTSSAGGSSSAEEFNNDIYIPLRTCMGRYGEKIYIRQSGSRSGEQVELHQITLTVRSMDEVRGTGDLIRYMLEIDPNHQKKDFAVTVPLDRLEDAERTKNRFTQMLAGIAGISLLVGGIGIMNIMVASVTERTREIGIRRALGAKRRDIISQFLVETVVQTTLGGLLGVLAGLGLIFFVPVVFEWLDFSLPAKLHGHSIWISLVFSIFVGLGFGLYPALRASRLDPIEALRHE